MGYTRLTPESAGPYAPHSAVKKRYWLHILLFIATFLSAMGAGTSWLMKDYTELSQWGHGFTYAVLLLAFLSAHEFGHYIAARKHGVDASLPFFIPMPLFSLMPFGTFGAIIKTRSPILSRKVLFDIAVSGPLAGFAVCLVILIIGLETLPPMSYLYQIHPEYAITGIVPISGMYFGDTLLFGLLRDMYSGSGTYFPPMNEIYHYPFLCVGWFGLVVTTLNMLPFGQLDGGHILYALIGKKQHLVATIIWRVLTFLILCGLIAIVHELLRAPSAYSPVIWMQQNVQPNLDIMIGTAPWLFEYFTGWIPWALLVRFMIGIKHPVIADQEPLDTKRQVLGWLSIAVLILSFAPRLIYVLP